MKTEIHKEFKKLNVKYHLNVCLSSTTFADLLLYFLLSYIRIH